MEKYKKTRTLDKLDSYQLQFLLNSGEKSCHYKKIALHWPEILAPSYVSKIFSSPWKYSTTVPSFRVIALKNLGSTKISGENKVVSDFT